MTAVNWGTLESPNRVETGSKPGRDSTSCIQTGQCSRRPSRVRVCVCACACAVLKEDIKPRDIMTRKAFENAVTSVRTLE